MTTVRFWSITGHSQKCGKIISVKRLNQRRTKQDRSEMDCHKSSSNTAKHFLIFILADGALLNSFLYFLTGHGWLSFQIILTFPATLDVLPEAECGSCSSDQVRHAYFFNCLNFYTIYFLDSSWNLYSTYFFWTEMKDLIFQAQLPKVMPTPLFNL